MTDNDAAKGKFSLFLNGSNEAYPIGNENNRMDRKATVLEVFPLFIMKYENKVNVNNKYTKNMEFLLE